MSQGRSSEPVAQAVQDAGSVPAACRRVGEELGINTDTLRGRAKQAQIDAGRRPGPVLPMARIRQLEWEDAEQPAEHLCAAGIEAATRHRTPEPATNPHGIVIAGAYRSRTIWDGDVDQCKEPSR